jgi:hypothetical protein
MPPLSACGRSLHASSRGVGAERIKKEGTVVITLDDLEYSYPDDGDHCYLCGRKWDSHSPWEFLYLDSNLLCEDCAPEYRRARSRRETKQE